MRTHLQKLIHHILLSTLALSAMALPAFSIAEEESPNYILMIGDDMAVETLNCYGVGDASAHTPNLNELCNMGVRFDNFWSQPVCSPTRATLLTGQYGFKNGVGSPVLSTINIDWKIPQALSQQGQRQDRGQNRNQTNQQDTSDISRPGLKADAHTFIQTLGSAGYQTAAIGKWHLADVNNGGLNHPLNAGFDHYSGSIRGGGVSTYDGWSKVVDGGEPFGQTGYATSNTVDDGIAWLSKIDTEEPFFLWVAFNAPHTPFHMPPKELLSSDARNLDPAAVNENPHAYYNAMIEAMDTEIGRLLDSLDEDTLVNTYVIFMGDNGTPDETVRAPFQQGKAKGGLYQGGVNVPLMVKGPGINAGQISTSLANSVDLFNTFLEISNTEPAKDTATHSISLTPILFDDVHSIIRDFAYADMFGVSNRSIVDARTIRNTQYKLIQNRLEGTEELYNLSSDPYEHNNLLATKLSTTDQTQYDELASHLKELTGE